MNIYIPETDDIYFSKTKEYFQEVLSSYANGNYRSAIVMLYSVVICDILFKLQELKDMYNDSKAIEILKKVEKCKENSDSKSAWEKELVELIHKETDLIDLEAYTNLSYLYNHRNFSAHPALNENYELISPSKETTIAHIKNMLNEILVKPPLFIKKIFGALAEDLKQKSDLYINDKDNLAIYLENKYYSRMTVVMKTKLFRFLWKLCFILTNDDCKQNRLINSLALEILTEKIKKEIIEEIKTNQKYYTVSYDKLCTDYLILFLSKYPEIHKELNPETLHQLDSRIEESNDAKLVAWFKFISLQKHVNWLLEFKSAKFSTRIIKLFIKHYTTVGELKIAIDFLISYYGNSTDYTETGKRFEYAILPILDKLNYSQCVNLIEVTTKNSQIYGYAFTHSNNDIIVKTIKNILEPTFDYSKYEKFKFNSAILSQKPVTEETDTQNEEIDI